MRYIVVLLFFIGAPFIGWAQSEFRISANVFDESGVPIPIADVLIFDGAHENLLQYTVVDNGGFELTLPGEKKYILEVSALGYEKYTVPLDLETSIELSIALKSKNQVLDEVEVRVTQNPITTSNGNTKINVQHPVFATIPDPLDILTKLPGLQLSADRQSVTLIGLGNPLIYLNKQRVDFEVVSALAVDAIESMELIQNPSAKYEANGRAVLLITTKRNANHGLKLNLQETASWKRNYNNSMAASGSYANKGFELRGNIGLNNLLPWESNTFLFSIPEADIVSDYFVIIPRNNRTQFNSGLGLFVPLGKEDYISFNSTLRRRTDSFPVLTDSFLEIEDETSTVFTDASNENSRDYFTSNLNLDKKLSSNLSLFAGFQYSLFSQSLETDISNDTNSSGLQREQFREQQYDLNSYAFRVDLEQKLEGNVTLEYGANVNEARADALSEIENFGLGNRDVLDFAYQEGLYAIYSSLKGKLIPKVDFSSGIRLEHNNVISELASEGSPLIERKNTRFFPRASLSVPIDSTKTLTVNYAKSIDRPNFSRTSTISVFINPVLEGAGNINLLPEITNEISSTLQYKNKSITLRYYRTKNPINFTISYDENLGTALLSQVNLEQETGFLASLSLPFSKGIWTSNTTLSLNYNNIKDNTAELGEARPYLYMYTNQQFKISKDTTIAFGGWALTKRREGIFERNAMLVADASIVKNFGDSFQCALRFNDIFRELNFEESYEVDGVESTGAFFVDGREVALSLRYTLGGQKKNAFKNKNVDENTDRIN